LSGYSVPPSLKKEGKLLIGTGGGLIWVEIVEQ